MSHSKSFQDLIIKKKGLKKITDNELINSFEHHMTNARHSEGNYIELEFAKLAMQERANRVERSRFIINALVSVVFGVIGSALTIFFKG